MPWAYINPQTARRLLIFEAHPTLTERIKQGSNAAAVFKSQPEPLVHSLTPEGELAYLARVGRLTPMSLAQIANIVGAIFVMGGNVYTVISPWDVYYTGRETYFTPASWSFFIWWVTTNAEGFAGHSANFYPGP